MVTAKQRAARALFAKRARAGSFRRAGSRIRRRLRRSRGSPGGVVLARRRRAAGRIRRIGRRVRRFHRPKLMTKILNAGSLALAFSPGITAVANDVKGNAMHQIPRDVIWSETGFDLNTGQWDSGQAARSAGVKISAVALRWTIGYFRKRWKF